MTGAASVAGRLMRNATSNFAGFAVGMVVNFVLFPITTSYIGAAAFGILVLANSLVGYSGLLSFGFRSTLIQKSAHLLARDEREALSTVASQIFTLYCYVSATVLAAVALGSWALPAVFNLSGESAELFRWVLLIVGVQSALSLPSQVWTGMVEARQDYHVVNAVKILTDLLRLLSTILLLKQGFGLVALVASYLCLFLLQWAISWAWIRDRLPSLRVRFSRDGWAEYRPLLRFTGSMFVVNFSGASEGAADKVLLGIFTSPAAITVFEVANRLTTYSRQLIVQMLVVLMPAASELKAEGNRALLRRVMISVSRMVIFAYGTAAVCLVAYGREFIRLWMGEEYVQAYPVLVLLVLAGLCIAHIDVPFVITKGMGVMREITRSAFIRMAINVVLSIVLLQRYGIAGVAAATLLAHAWQAVTLTRYFGGLFEMGSASLIRQVYLPAWLPLMATSATALLTHQVFFEAGWIGLVLAVVVSSLVGAAAFWAWGVEAGERSRIVALLRSRAPQLLPRASN